MKHIYILMTCFDQWNVRSDRCHFEMKFLKEKFNLLLSPIVPFSCQGKEQLCRWQKHHLPKWEGVEQSSQLSSDGHVILARSTLLLHQAPAALELLSQYKLTCLGYPPSSICRNSKDTIHFWNIFDVNIM